MKIELHQGNCLEVMKSIPDGSIDMILADPPYGTTACKWDIRDLASASIEKIEDNLFEVVRVVDRVCPE